jgi:dTDP-4-dehydrorhamnose 3,5-epimerase
VNADSAATRDAAHIAPDGRPLKAGIDGVTVRPGHTLVTRNGHTTELFSAPWGLGAGALQHLIHVSLKPSAISAWHRHAQQTDHIAVIDGMLRLVMYDPRPASPTSGQVDELHLSPLRASLVVIPPGIWHGLQNMLPHAFSSFINGFDRPYRHDDPDEWRLPHDTAEIPYRFPTG